jgi:hypothetical protein
MLSPMQKVRFKRWQRILIVLSIFWLPFGGVWGWRHAHDEADAKFKLCVAAIPATTLESCRAERARALAVPRGVSAGIVALAPVAAFWLIIYGFIWVARRIRRAFSP